MMQLLIGLIAGGVFGAGLVVSQMTDPARVLGFLDVFGHWDPRLAFVMLGAIGVHAPVVAWLRRRGRPVFGSSLHLPERTRIDRRLVIGAAIFGVGWGLAGYCPGPALVATLASPAALMLTLSMSAGIFVHDLLLNRRAAPDPSRGILARRELQTDERMNP
jgi:uncharacterized membrane protein YedE/YeeE